MSSHITPEKSKFRKIVGIGDECKYVCEMHIIRSPARIHIHTRWNRSFYVHSMRDQAKRTVIHNKKNEKSKKPKLS
jgi:hypothetical protein